MAAPVGVGLRLAGALAKGAPAATLARYASFRGCWRAKWLPGCTHRFPAKSPG